MAKKATRVHILNGNEGIGASSSIIEVDGERILLDAGIKIGKEKGGYECSFANLENYLNNPPRSASKKIDAILLTHKHADHLDALLNYARMGYQLPKIIASSETVDFLRLQFAKEPDLKKPEFMKVKPGKANAVKIGKNFEVEALAAPHATKGAMAYFVQTKIDDVKDSGLLHFGDFHTRQSLNSDRDFLADLKNFVKDKKIDAFFVDSTSSSNARTDVRSAEEQTKNVYDVFKNQGDNRIIATCISRSDNNLELILDAAQKAHKKVFLLGDGLRDTWKVMQLNGHLKYKDAVFHSMSAEEFKLLPKNQQIVVAAGALGDGPNKDKKSSLTKIVSGENMFFDVDDKTIMCYFQREIPAVDTEGQIAAQKEVCRAKGATVIETINGEFLESGHAVEKELEAVAKIIKKENPYAICIPTHGTQEQLGETQNVFDNNGLKTQVFKNGAVFAIYDGSLVTERKEILNGIGLKEVMNFDGSSTITYDEIDVDGKKIKEVKTYEKPFGKVARATKEDVARKNGQIIEKANKSYEKALANKRNRGR